MSSQIPNFLGGAIIFGFTIISLFFLKFWRRTRDPFFGAFALAFFLMGVGRVIEAMVRFEAAQNAEAANPAVFLFRFVAFGILIFAIVQKNWASKK